MNHVVSDTSFEIRPYRPEDEPGVLDLLTAALGGGPAGHRSSEFFRWKHLANPFGPSPMLIAEADGRIVGFRAFMRWRFRAGSRVVRALRAVDTATHPEYQGRGVFSRLTREAIEALQGDADLVFNTPNERSLRGYLKMGWQVVGRLPLWVRVRRPIRFLSALRSLRDPADGSLRGAQVDAETAADALSDADAVSRLLELASGDADLRLVTDRNLPYLTWRYGGAHFLDYRAVREERDGGLRGLAFFRVRPRGPLKELTIADMIVSPGDRRTASRLFRRIVGAARVDHIVCSFPPVVAPVRVMVGCGFVRSPAGPLMVENTLREGIDPDPQYRRSWALSLGDLEVF